MGTVSLCCQNYYKDMYDRETNTTLETEKNTENGNGKKKKKRTLSDYNTFSTVNLNHLIYIYKY